MLFHPLQQFSEKEVRHLLYVQASQPDRLWLRHGVRRLQQEPGRQHPELHHPPRRRHHQEIRIWHLRRNHFHRYGRKSVQYKSGLFFWHFSIISSQLESIFGPLHFNIRLAYFSVDFGLRETSAAFNSPGKLHGRSVCWLPGLGLGVGQVRTKNGYDGCHCHSGEVVKEIFPSPHFTVKYCTVNDRLTGKKVRPFLFSRAVVSSKPVQYALDIATDLCHGGWGRHRQRSRYLCNARAPSSIGVEVAIASAATISKVAISNGH